MEIEKKFRIRRLPEELEQKESFEIEQAYITRKPTIRIRKKNDSYILTIKVTSLDEKKEGILVNHETEILITKEEYGELLKKIDGSIIKKRRYLIPLEDGKTAELDIFEGRLSGLIFVEVEFSSIKEAENFIPPSWFGEDVSEDRRFCNTELSKLTKYKREDFE